ncbi:hypothetical protein JGI7_00240 [Candidatus Kryptonium thompsonii]|uniref:hypothetical protein n=1 Tax=Candidatus Kryptonium thompsonii TaxID=1633631 RepID=UPI00063E8A91|nr:hypothetical protein [Candidatus Kryptonium thompsoni]CUS78700.1 hypothetical protein JGI7_00240 [Candidatus Kryptonium thompsoni]CUS88136.1 hypothetical protein JGI12_01127 [Candidatus Kryptonium thompsoni]CUT01656.1 hypothetical protein JGI5_01410 [Candidatus Kryptonium thompsoni]CUT08066.1 hypothetical protein JGI9_01284 [Candidatus Kryptonium thompsoni]
MKNEVVKSFYLTLPRFEDKFLRRCSKCGNETIFIRRCCGDNEVWRCEKCEYVEKEVNQNIWYYYIWAK